MADIPRLKVQIKPGEDGKPFVALTRGELAWVRVRYNEITTICDQLIDALEAHEKESTR